MLNIIKKYLKLNKYYNQEELFEEAFLSHPNYPSLYAVTDSLNYVSIENLAVKIPKEQFSELPEIFTAVFKRELFLVTKEESSVLIEDDKGKKVKLSFDEFLSDWDQIILVVEPNAEENNIDLKNNYSKWFLYLLPVGLLVLLSVFSNNFSVSGFLTLGTTLIGLGLSVLILQEKYGIKTEVGSKLCNLGTETSCDSVIRSDKGEIIKGLSFYDLPILFFGINFLALLLSPETSGVIISILSLISIPFLFYSVWLQKNQIKKWCLLCLAVSSVILIQGFFFLIGKSFFGSDFVSGILNYLMSSVIIGSAWFLIRPLLEKEIKLKDELNTHKRFKRNFKVFRFMMKKIEVQEGFESLKGITYGDSNAVVKLTFFLSPSCGHCHKAFKDAVSLFEKNRDKIYLKILFNVNPENRDNKYLQIVETLLTLNSSDEEIAKEALNDWHGKNLGIEMWKEKWPSLTHDMIVNNQLQKQYEWCLVNNFNYTPVKIVNNELFPNEYELNDLQYFINEYSEEAVMLQNEENLKIV
ncbi:vitamin K epoxide reductase family protein [Flavobacterium sp. H122]|uniref:vitamin K epoxide reductase family protein n=1 Tax=Flavobacterium sp. H122 TaxID=2529860 RepID=UPI0010AAB3FD|nr:vitamin K epoxide reductase family protein [Flavobacterium sp. H122]